MDFNNIESFEHFSKLKTICRNLIQDQKNIACLKELNATIKNSPESFVKVVQPTILSTFYPILKSISEDKTCFKDDEKQLIVEALKNVFDKSNIEKIGLFFNIYSFLLFEIYDHFAHRVLPIHEEYKLSIIECMTSLAKCVSSDLVFTLYTRENSPKLCQMLYVAIELAKTEQLRSLRIAAIQCIMAIARVLNDDDFEDLEVRNQVAEMFLFFLPGVASGLKKIALEDEKVGHKVIMTALMAWGRIITLLMQNYNGSEPSFDFEQFKNALNKSSSPSASKKIKFKDNAEIQEYLQTTQRSTQWYNDTDKKLQPLVVELTKLTHHSHPKVRVELANMCGLVTRNCFTTMSGSVSHLIEIVITLSEDDNEEVRQKSCEILNDLSKNLSSFTFKSLLENLEQGFYNGIISLPRKFNGIDEKEQLAALNLIVGYINLFGKHKLEQVLLSTTHLKKLMFSLIHISELEKGNVSLLEEYTIQDLETNLDSKTPWKNFRHFKEESIKCKLEQLCASLANFGAFRLVSDFLLDVIAYQVEHRKEALLILNEVISGIKNVEENFLILTDILTTYIDSNYWNIPLTVTIDEFGYENTLADVQNNVIQVCLLVEGIGKIATVSKKCFQQFLLKTLYLVLERAGSAHPLVKSAGLLALKNVTFACGYTGVTDLINTNIDYFTYHVERKLNRIENNESVFDVLTVVLKYSTIDVLQYIADIIQEVLIQSCDRFKEKNATAFLRVFKMFIQCLRRWFNIGIKIEPFKTKAQKLEEIENFQVTGVNMEEESFSDDIMGKTAEEMYKEDMEKKQKELEDSVEEPEVEEYKKPEPPLHIKLTVAVLGRSLHFLPSKDRTRKILVLNILTDGIEILRDWEDELLPIVHQIWSPLVRRFKELDDPLIINYSFQLLVVLARLSKDFIRSRTVNEVLPSIVEVLDKLSQESFLKDRGSAYRYSQAYKLQIGILENLARVLTDLDVQQDKKTEPVLDSIFKYLSDKQPAPLQSAAIDCLKVLTSYDPQPMKLKLENWKKINAEEFGKNVIQLCSLLDEIK